MVDLRDRLRSELGERYGLGGELGGGMSRVFLAQEIRLGREVVVKVLPPELAAGVSAERFEREMQLADRAREVWAEATPTTSCRRTRVREMWWRMGSKATIPAMHRTLVTLLAALVVPVIAPAQDSTAPDPIIQLVGRLDLERYKATIKGLTNFGDRRQGTDRNRAAVDWIEAQLRSYGCGNVSRLKYDYPPAQRTDAARPPQRDTSRASGGGRYRGIRGRTGVNTDSLKQPDARVRALDAQLSTPGPREEVYCTKIGDAHPGEMYIVGGHMDGIGWGEAANDDGSGAALVMELARIFSSSDVHTDRSIRFILWNNEESGLNGSRAYVDQRRALQGTATEPRWLGMIQHDMMLFDHGMPRADGTLAPDQRPEADVNIEFQSSAKFSAEAQELAWVFERANEKYATDYPASVGSHMTNTDSAPFQDYVPAISLRENERGTQIGAGWDPNWHQPTDLYTTYSDKDFRLGLNAAQTTLGALAGLAGATIR